MRINFEDFIDIILKKKRKFFFVKCTFFFETVFYSNSIGCGVFYAFPNFFNL